MVTNLKLVEKNPNSNLIYVECVMESTKTRLVLDGGFGTELVSAHGQQFIDNDPLWSARLLSTNTDVLKKVHLSFLECGSDVITTATYQASIEGFMKHLGLSREQAHQLIITSGEIAEQVRDDFWSIEANRNDRQKPLIAGSLGPYGACLQDMSEFTGNYVDTMSLEELSTWHSQQIAAHRDSPVDILAFETIPALKEAEAIINILRQYPDTKAWISFSCKDKERTCHGDLFTEAVAMVARCDNVVAVGMNCLPPDNVQPLLKIIPEYIKQSKNIIVYPNSGEQWFEDTKWVGEETCTPLDRYIPGWLDCGATWIGGCCRVKPAAITGIRNAMISCQQSS